ncbi:MAG: glycosyltransferase family 2 protein, partial [Holophagae bacterium]|nr:glycosyltransferase family 2 protein [Holophagae bacterium]
MNGKNDISVVIPVLNGADQLRKLVQSIRDQQHCVIREIIVIDSASDDETFEISRELHLTFLPLQHRYQFDHGGTRTNAARTAQGEFVFFLTQDVELNDKMAVSKLLAPMQKIPEIAACY